MSRTVALSVLAALMACSPSGPSKPTPPGAAAASGAAPGSQPGAVACEPAAASEPAAAGPASRPSRAPVARAPGSDAGREDLRALNTSIKSEVLGAGQDLRMPRRQGAGDDWREALGRAARAARRISQAFDRYAARTPEVKSLAKEAAKAWGGLGDAYSRLGAEMAKATRDAAVDDPAPVKDAKDAADRARTQVDEVMRKLGRLADQQGL